MSSVRQRTIEATSSPAVASLCTKDVLLRGTFYPKVRDCGGASLPRSGQLHTGLAFLSLYTKVLFTKVGEVW